MSSAAHWACGAEMRHPSSMHRHRRFVRIHPSIVARLSSETYSPHWIGWFPPKLRFKGAPGDAGRNHEAAGRSDSAVATDVTCDRGAALPGHLGNTAYPDLPSDRCT